MDNIPWIEKYRPKSFEGIVLDKINKKIIKNIIETRYFPNLLFYGPPGTGKTTTIITLINYYQHGNSQNNKELKIHLNASDDRGIDIIRNQIKNFVSTKSLFTKGLKFVILDEVDYMTKNAQQALRNLIQQSSSDVRFCLICNYISRIVPSLQNEFIRLRFSQLPKKDIYKFLTKISEKENIKITPSDIKSIQKIYKSDLRSMINFLQSNHINNHNVNYNIISKNVWESLIKLFKQKEENITINKFIQLKSLEFNIKGFVFLKKFIEYIISTHLNLLTPEFMRQLSFVYHKTNVTTKTITFYIIYIFKQLWENHDEDINVL